MLIETKRQGSKTSALAKVKLNLDIWTSKIHKNIEDIKHLIVKRVTLGHLKSDKRLCMNTDTSKHYWACILTQILLENSA